MSSRAKALLALAMAAPLAYMYLLFLSWVISNRILPGANYVETTVVATQLIRLVLIVSVKRLRRASITQVFNIFSIEIFSFPALIALSLLFGDHYLLSVALTIVATLPSGLLCVVPALVIYRLTSAMGRDRRLLFTVPPAIALFALFAFVTGAVISQPAPVGLGGLSSLLLSALLKTRSIDTTPLVVLASIPLYLSLATYASTQGGGVSGGR